MGVESVLRLFLTTELEVPIFHLILLHLFATIALLFRNIKIAIIINYIFLTLWGYVLNKSHLYKAFQYGANNLGFLYLYFGFIFICI